MPQLGWDADVVNPSNAARLISLLHKGMRYGVSTFNALVFTRLFQYAVSM